MISLSKISLGNNSSSFTFISISSSRIPQILLSKRSVVLQPHKTKIRQERRFNQALPIRKSRSAASITSLISTSKKVLFQSFSRCPTNSLALFSKNPSRDIEPKTTKCSIMLPWQRWAQTKLITPWLRQLPVRQLTITNKCFLKALNRVLRNRRLVNWTRSSPITSLISTSYTEETITCR